MGVLTDPQIRAQYVGALSLWNCTGYINWKGPARAFVERELEAHTIKFIGKLMYEHVMAGGKIFQVVETRPEWLESKFRYDLYVLIDDREIYLETVLCDDKPDDCTILVVSAHDP